MTGLKDQATCFELAATLYLGVYILELCPVKSEMSQDYADV